MSVSIVSIFRMRALKEVLFYKALCAYTIIFYNMKPKRPRNLIMPS